MEGNKGWSVQRSSSLLLLFPPHGFPLLQGRLSTGCSFIRHIHLIWHCSLWAAAWMCSRMELLPLCWSWCSLCCISLLLFPPLPVWLLLPFFTHIALEIPPALLMGSAEFCSGSVAELLTSFPRGHLCRSSACHPSPWGPQQLRVGLAGRELLGTAVCAWYYMSCETMALRPFFSYSQSHLCPGYCK